MGISCFVRGSGVSKENAIRKAEAYEFRKVIFGSGKDMQAFGYDRRRFYSKEILAKAKGTVGETVQRFS